MRLLGLGLGYRTNVTDDVAAIDSASARNLSHDSGFSRTGSGTTRRARVGCMVRGVGARTQGALATALVVAVVVGSMINPAGAAQAAPDTPSCAQVASQQATKADDAFRQSWADLKSAARALDTAAFDGLITDAPSMVIRYHADQPARLAQMTHDLNAFLSATPNPTLGCKTFHDGDSAVFDIAGSDGEKPIGQLVFLRHDGEWKVSGLAFPGLRSR